MEHARDSTATRRHASAVRRAAPMACHCVAPRGGELGSSHPTHSMAGRQGRLVGVRQQRLRVSHEGTDHGLHGEVVGRVCRRVGLRRPPRHAARAACKLLRGCRCFRDSRCCRCRCRLGLSPRLGLFPGPKGDARRAVGGRDGQAQRPPSGLRLIHVRARQAQRAGACCMGDDRRLQRQPGVCSIKLDN